MEELINFQSTHYRIEGRLAAGNESNGVVITHPHPFYGGNMSNPVVETVATHYQKNGYTTLRFNFRGVGNSQGHYDNGMGEQEDICAAITYLTKMGIKKVELAGYSFGAWVNALATTSGKTIMDATIMVSPPVGFIDFESIRAIKGLKLVVTGSRDEIAPANLIRKLLATWSPEAYLEIIEGCDHFYFGYLKKLESVLSQYI